METLNKVNKTELLSELKGRIAKHEITEFEVIAILKNYLAEEEEVWKKDYERAAQDEQRNKEAEEWDRLELEDSKKNGH